MVQVAPKVQIPSLNASDQISRQMFKNTLLHAPGYDHAAFALSLCVAVTGCDCTTQRRNHAQRTSASRVAPLTQVPIEALSEIEVALPDHPAWRFA